MIFSLEAAVTRLTASPPDPSFAIERRDLTLVWDYILDGSVAFALFLNLTGGGNAERIARQLFGRSVIVEPKYQDRFTVVLTDSQASLKIRRVQRSDEGEYDFTLSPTGTGNINNKVEVIVLGNVNAFLLIILIKIKHIIMMLLFIQIYSNSLSCMSVKLHVVFFRVSFSFSLKLLLWYVFRWIFLCDYFFTKSNTYSLVSF